MKKFSNGYLSKFNWEEIQEFYNNGNFWKDVIDKFKISNSALSYAVNINLFKTRGRSQSTKLQLLNNPRHLSEETKKKISEGRIKYLLENPDKIPYKLNHSSKESYPEKYFGELFKKEKMEVERYFSIELYELDFCIPDKKIDIEIDGSQHYCDDKIMESDIKRTKYLKENGWDVIRINWSDYQKMSYVEKTEYIKKLKKYIDNLIIEKPTISFMRLKKGINLCECGEQKYKTSKRCEKCRRLNDRKIERPSYEQLLKEIQESNYSAVGRKYGVCDNTIKKWVRYYEKN